MLLEKMLLQNFRCFGSIPEEIHFDSGLTALVGDNGSGKTATLLALQRMFGVQTRHQRLVRQDFHVSASEPEESPGRRTLAIECFFGFPELEEGQEPTSAVPLFFQQIGADDNGKLKLRIRLEGIWTDNGTAEGLIDEKCIAISTMASSFSDEQKVEFRSYDRARIQVIYIPAIRDGVSQLGAFLSGRLWKAVRWSDDVKGAVKEAGKTLSEAFLAERGVASVADASAKRWRDLHSGGTYATPRIAPIDLRFERFIRTVSVQFHPDEEGGARGLDELSDGQRSLFHLALIAATLDVESSIAQSDDDPFDIDSLTLPALTIIAIEEPENSLAPFYLSRIITQVKDVTARARAQAIVASHSASILARVEPEQIRHFRLNRGSGTAHIRPIRLPVDVEEASKYVREAVRTYPELYFASFVVLGEGATEEIVIPRLAEAMKVPIDRSFVAVVPLGGRHVKYLWRLLNDIEVPHATLLDLDVGRSGGGWGRIKSTCLELIENDVKAASLIPDLELLQNQSEAESLQVVAKLDQRPLDYAALAMWCTKLQEFGVYFCSPLDLDMSMLTAFEEEYQSLESSQRGPSNSGDAALTVLGVEGDTGAYDASWDDRFRWYRYLFLGRGKPTTHVRVLATADNDSLAASAPVELKDLIAHVHQKVYGTQTGQPITPHTS